MTGTSAETRSVVIEREIAHPPEKLWRALTQPHLMEEWLMKNDFKPSVGHKFNLRGEWGGVLDCEVLAIEPNRSLSYTWDYKHDDAAFNLKSVVTFTLTPTSEGTHLRVERFSDCWMTFLSASACVPRSFSQKSPPSGTGSPALFSFVSMLATLNELR